MFCSHCNPKKIHLLICCQSIYHLLFTIMLFDLVFQQSIHELLEVLVDQTEWHEDVCRREQVMGGVVSDTV